MSSSGQTELENKFLREDLLNDIRQRPRSLRPTPPRFPKAPPPPPNYKHDGFDFNNDKKGLARERFAKMEIRYVLGNGLLKSHRLPSTLLNNQQGIQNSAETRLDIADSLNEIRIGPPAPPPPAPSWSQIYGPLVNRENHPFPPPPPPTAHRCASIKPRMPPTLQNHQQVIQNSAETRLDIAESLNEIRLERPAPPIPRPSPPRVPADFLEPNSNEQPTENSATETNEDISADKQSARKTSRCILL